MADIDFPVMAETSHRDCQASSFLASLLLPLPTYVARGVLLKPNVLPPPHPTQSKSSVLSMAHMTDPHVTSLALHPFTLLYVHLSPNTLHGSLDSHMVQLSPSQRGPIPHAWF